MSRVFGLTGGIASGKSTVSRLFVEQGVPLVDADLIAREVVEPGTFGLQRIVETFGDVLNEDGTLNRAKLGAMIFVDPKKRGALNEIMLPLISLTAGDMMRTYLEEGHPLVCYDAPTLIESGFHERFRPLVVVVVPEDVQLKRLMARNGFTEAEARARISSQVSNDERRALADFIIDNNGTLDDLRVQALGVLSQLRTRYKRKVAG